MRVEIAGPICAGKTTLARVISSHLSWSIAEEAPDENPFWASTYKGDWNSSFEKDVTFSLMHGRSIKDATTTASLVCDFSLTQDLAYARLGKDKEAFLVFEHVHRLINVRCGRPNLLIVLRCATSTLLQRIAVRGREPEQAVSVAFLDQLVAAIDQEVGSIGVPVVEIDSEALDFRARPREAVQKVMLHIAGLVP